MSLEPSTVAEPARGDLIAARYWLDLAASNLPADVFDGSNPDHLKVAVSLGEGYANLAHIERVRDWRAEDLARLAKDRADDLARLAQNRDEDFEVREAEEEDRRQREAEALATMRNVVGALRRFPCDWRAVHILPGTPYPDEPSEIQPPGWYVFGGFSNDAEEGAAFAIEITEALDRDDTGMSLERLAQTVAARLNGVQS